MNNSKVNRSNLSPDEIDLIGVLVKTIRFFQKNWTVFFVSILAGVALGLFSYFTKDKVYESRFTGECMSIPDARTIELLNDLEKLRDNEDFDQLAKKLGMKPNQAKLIHKIEPLSNITIDKEAKGVDDYLLSTAEIAYKFSIIVQVKDNSVLPFFQKGIIKYLSENEYSTIRVNRFIENRKSLLKSVEKEQKKLDSLNLLFADKIVNSNTSSTITSPGDFKATIITLEEKKLTIEDELRFAQPGRVIQGFTAFNKPVEPILKIVMLKYVSLFLALGFAFILLRNLAQIYLVNKDQYL